MECSDALPAFFWHVYAFAYAAIFFKNARYLPRTSECYFTVDIGQSIQLLMYSNVPSVCYVYSQSIIRTYLRFSSIMKFVPIVHLREIFRRGNRDKMLQVIKILIFNSVLNWHKLNSDEKNFTFLATW
jgi:hypothetical protein